MPHTNRPLKVFLCHAHADRDAVRALYARLTKDGIDAWLDKEKLLPGQDWEFEIRKAVREADVVVVCLSKQFNQAGFRQREVRLALDTAMEKPEGEIFIVPARLDECDSLESLRKWHWVDLFEEDGYEMLMRTLRARADKIDATVEINNECVLDDEVVIPVASSVEYFLQYLRNYLSIDSHKLRVSLGDCSVEERYNKSSSEWQMLFFWLIQKTEIQDRKEVIVREFGGEKIGVFSLSKLSQDRSKLRITRSDRSEEFDNYILGLIKQLRDDNLVDGTIRGLSR
ncbi:MAG: toll/interleukin-1 receptor domain-containing protein [Chloroflexota bacterium]